MNLKPSCLISCGSPSQPSHHAGYPPIATGALAGPRQGGCMAEKRTSERRRALRAGKIVWNKGGSVIDCTVRNISKTGALIGVLSAIMVPEEFELRWDGNVQRCMVIWRKPDCIGVKFVP